MGIDFGEDAESLFLQRCPYAADCVWERDVEHDGLP
jgi:hypothetical protein